MGAEICEMPRQIRFRFWNQNHKGFVQMRTYNPSCSRILNNIKYVLAHEIKKMQEEFDRPTD
jgi:hypothetical protein